MCQITSDHFQAQLPGRWILQFIGKVHELCVLLHVFRYIWHQWYLYHHTMHVSILLCQPRIFISSSDPHIFTSSHSGYIQLDSTTTTTTTSNHISCSYLHILVSSYLYIIHSIELRPRRDRDIRTCLRVVHVCVIVYWSESIPDGVQEGRTVFKAIVIRSCALYYTDELRTRSLRCGRVSRRNERIIRM